MRLALLSPLIAALLAGTLASAGLPSWMFALLCAAAAGGCAALWQARVHALERARSDFVQGVSHELRTPVAQIRLLSETLLLGNARPEEQARWLESIAREAQVLDDRIASVLLVAHADGTGARLPRGAVDLSALVEDVAAGCAGAAADRGARLHSQGDGAAHAQADPRMLRLALVNLIDNSLRYGPAGQTVTVSARTVDGSAVLTVADQGPGMPAGAWPAAPAGLGLTAVQRIARDHGGRVTLESAATGARVHLILPLALP